MLQLALICGAGAVGTGCRYLLGLWIAARWGTAFPFGTLVVNVLGCFLMALLVQLAGQGLSTMTRLALTVGFLGGFTTYSSFAFETFQLAQRGAWATALGYFGVTSLLCLLAVGGGAWLGRALV